MRIPPGVIYSFKKLFSTASQSFFGKTNARPTWQQTKPIANIVLKSSVGVGTFLFNAPNNYKKPEELYLDHLAVSLGSRTAETLQILQNWFIKLPEATQRYRVRSFMGARKALQNSPTDEAEVINHLRESGCPMHEIIEIHGLIMDKALQSFEQMLHTQKIKPDAVSLNFRGLASKENIDSLVTAYHKNCEIPDLTVDTQGNVSNTHKFVAHGLHASPK